MSDALCYRDLKADNERLREQVKQFKESIAFASVTIAVLRSQVDDLTEEITRLKEASGSCEGVIIGREIIDGCMDGGLGKF